MQQAPKAVLVLKDAEQILKCLVICKEVQSLGEGQAIAGSHQDGIRFLDFLCDWS